ncbi:hypothetical protein D9M71_169750 [compost metagenome]
MQAGATMALHGGARAVQGQLQDLLLTGQACAPVGQLAFALTGLHPVPLPDGVVGVLDRQGRQGAFLPLAAGSIALDQFGHHHLHRGAVGDDVVQGHHQYMVVGAQAQQAHTQQWATLQVEQPADLVLDIGLDLLIAGAVVAACRPFIEGNAQAGLLCNLLANAVGGFDEGGAQALVAGDQLIEAVLQRGNVQRAAQAQGDGNVVGRAGRVELPEEPLALLGKGQRQAVEGGLHFGDRQVGRRYTFGEHLVQKLATLVQRQGDEAAGDAAGGNMIHHACSSSSNSDSSLLNFKASMGLACCANASTRVIKVGN